MNKKRLVVSLYRCWQAYGGSEEGGWYFECGNPVGKYETFFNQEKAYARRQEIQDQIKEEGHLFEGCGVGGCGDDDGLMRGEAVGDDDELTVYVMEIKRGGPQAFPERTPYYE